MGDNTQQVTPALVVEGTIEGDVISQSAVLVRESGHVLGDIASPMVEVSGQVDGSIRAEELILHEGAKVQGDILLWQANDAHGDGRPRARTSADDRRANVVHKEQAAPRRPLGLHSPNLTPLRPSVETARPASAEPSAGLGGPSVELTVGPFSRFSQLAEFLQALSSLTGVEKVETRQFYQGTVQLRVRYSNPIPLATRLQELASFQPQVSRTASGLEVRLHVPAQLYELEPRRVSEPVEGGPELHSSAS